MSGETANIPILTIAIPTYNRSKLLLECLNNLTKEVNELENPEVVEILISDNASTDCTRKMLEEKFSEIKYYCNEKNMGVEYNVDRCFQYANGQYTYILSDDDILLPGSLDEIIKMILRYKPNFIHLNTVNFYRKFIDLAHCTEPRLRLVQNVVTNDKNSFFELVNIHVTYLSSSVYRTSIAKTVDRNRYKGEFISSGQTVLYCLKEPGNYIAIKQPCVAGRGGNTGGYNLYTVWVKGYRRLILQIGDEAGIEEKILKKVYKKTMRKQVLGFILAFRTTEKGLSLENRHYIFEGVKEFPALWIPFIVATYAPPKFLMFIMQIYQRCKRK